MLQKNAIDVNFAQGLDTKTDPKQITIGKFLKLQNTIFNKGGLLQKRNGYGLLSALPDNSSTYLTTLNGNLTAVGTSIAAYSAANSNWVSKGSIQPMSITTLPLIRNNFNQSQADTVIAPNGLACTVYVESDGTTTYRRYAISDSITGQNIVAPTIIPVSVGVVTGGMRVFLLGNIFVLVFTNVIAGISHLQYVAISSSNPSVASTHADITALYIPSSTLAWDGYVVGAFLYIAYNTTTGGQSIKIATLSSSLTLSAPTTFAGSIATMVSVTADATTITPTIYLTFYNSATSLGYTAVLDNVLGVIVAPTLVIPAGVLLNIVSAAQNGTCKIFGEVSNNYTFGTPQPTHYISSVSITQAGVVSAITNTIRSVGLASKAFIVEGVIYFLAAFQSAYQPTYFLINGNSLESAPIISAKLAYSNGGGYLTTGLPNVTVNGNTAQVAYLFKDLIQATNKDTNNPAGTQVNGIYSQTGINLGTLAIGTDGLDTSEIAGNLHLSGGFLWMYDGYLPVEHNFFLWPDTDTGNAVWSAAGGSMAAKPDALTNTNAYFYQFVYEWTDNVGNAYKSAPSIPVAVTTTGAGTAGSVTLKIPTLRLTYKTMNPVKIVIYRWSVGQQIYYQTTSITSPLLNSTTVDSVTYVDTNSDATILGNNIIYTTGGVIEDVNAPASNLMTLFDTRLWLVDAEDKNLLWYSKQVIEAVPVEMSDLFTIFVPPTTSTQGTTGPITAISVMDDKLIIGKENAFLYINGTGPDNTGANNQYSPPTFITSTVGCTNQKSIVLQPQGLMFQSDKGIWLLDRSLSTSFIGAEVEEFTNGATVLSAVNVPATNQVRFILDTGITLMYDYYFNQWGTFNNVPAVSSCIYQDLHTYITSSGSAYQEAVGKYLDGSTPVSILLKTGPLRLDKLQSYQRAYFFYLLGTYISPHKLMVSIFYDYSDNPSHSVLIRPTNFSAVYGGVSPYGQGNYGGNPSLEEWRVFFKEQRCKAINIQIEEIYDSTLGVPAGAGLTLSGLNIVCGFKSKFVPMPANNSAG